jgi:hypothetical protein
MVSVLRSQEKIEQSQIKIERFRAFDYSFFANFADWARNPPNDEKSALALGQVQENSGGL